VPREHAGAFLHTPLQRAATPVGGVLMQSASRLTCFAPREPGALLVALQVRGADFMLFLTLSHVGCSVLCRMSCW
jgi:hypothetical protein